MNHQEQLIASVNGIFLPLTEATVHIEDRGFQFADGVYEVIACFAGHFLDMDEHLARLQRSCQAIDLTLPLSISELKTRIHETYRRNPFDHAMLYVQVTRGQAPRSHHIANQLKPTLVITARQLPEPSNEKIAQGATAITLPDIRWKRCDIKSISLLASVMGKQEAARQQVDETFWLDESGHVLEGCSTNCFAVINQQLVTHPLDHRILEGITRKLLLNIAQQHHQSIEQRPWTLSEPGISEVFMTSTTNAAMPVCRINGQKIGDGHPGSVSMRLRQWLLDHFEALKS